MALVVFVFPMVLFPLENWLNEAYSLNIRMAFQLIRIQKMTILPLYFSIGFLFLFVYEQFQRVKKWTPWVVGVYFLLVILAQPKTFKGVYFLSDDITTRIFPKWETLFLPFEERKTPFDKMAAYVAAETPEQAVFYKNYRIRAAASKSVLMDTKGPGMLIEGNPQKLVSWYRTYEKIQAMKSPEKWEALKQLGVTHVLLRKDPKEDYLQLLHQEGAYLLFKIK